MCKNQIVNEIRRRKSEAGPHRHAKDLDMHACMCEEKLACHWAVAFMYVAIIIYISLQRSGWICGRLRSMLRPPEHICACACVTTCAEAERHILIGTWNEAHKGTKKMKNGQQRNYFKMWLTPPLYYTTISLMTCKSNTFGLYNYNVYWL